MEGHSSPKGLQQTVLKSSEKIALRFFVGDDSGSMTINDGQRVAKDEKGITKLIKCSRWEELSETVKFLAELSDSLGAPSEFRLLNGADPIITGLGDDDGESVTFLGEVLQEEPAGQTPLCAHIATIVAEITSVKDLLKANNQKAAVVICTDGESSDGNVADALRPLTVLPVMVILRLCTSEKSIVDYCNNIDA